MLNWEEWGGVCGGGLAAERSLQTSRCWSPGTDGPEHPAGRRGGSQAASSTTQSLKPPPLKLETRNWLPKRLVLGGTSEEHLVHLPLSTRTQPFCHCLCLILLQMAARLPLLLQQRLEERLRGGLKGRFLSQPALKASWALLPGHPSSFGVADQSICAPSRSLKLPLNPFPS